MLAIGGTLEAYRHDLRSYFQWASDNGGLAASTSDRRLSTACGLYRFAHIDARIGSNPAHYVRRPQVHPTDARGLDRSELNVFLFTAEQYDHHHAGL